MLTRFSRAVRELAIKRRELLAEPVNEPERQRPHYTRKATWARVTHEARHKRLVDKLELADAMHRQATALLLEHLRELDRVFQGTGFAHDWGVVLVDSRELPLDGFACDWLDLHPWPQGWHVVRRPRSRAQ